MKTLRSYVLDAWHEADGDFRTLVDPSTEEAVARASSRGVDFQAVLEHARTVGGPALRALGHRERGGRLKAMSKALREHRDELLELSRRNGGTTRPDGAFDVDGATGTLHYYASLAKALEEGTLLPEDDGTQVGKSEAMWVRHALTPRRGAAVHVNAFNFPAWGFAEKAAQALLAGMPVITKPATATALVAERCVEIVVEAGILPEGALQLIVGGTGDLLDRLGPQDVLAFTGSADTAATLARAPGLGVSNARFNVEADSLNAAVLAPDVEEGETFQLFVRDVAREMTQKSGQKCTAVRRILVPEGSLERVREALVAALEGVVVGNPEADEVTMGPLATEAQLRDTVEGVRTLAEGCRIVTGGMERVDGVGSPEGTGYFFPPTLLEATDSGAPEAVHGREVFAPVATLVPYDGSAEAAAGIVARGGGMLVTSVYGDDAGWLRSFVEGAGPWAGRMYVGSRASAGEAPGSGVVFPHALHGGPGRAGGGQELGGAFGLHLYMQRTALQGSRSLLETLLEE